MSTRASLMDAMVLERLADLTTASRFLTPVRIPVPVPAPGEILVRVAACGVCHTELDEIEGRTPPPVFPMVPGHEIVGHVAALGPGARRFKEGDRVGIAWIHSACGGCGLCREGFENLCAEFRATGRDAPGGYAEYTVVPEAFAFPIPERFSDAGAAPLLCAGAVGYRSLRLTEIENGQALGLTGFGASGHLVLQMARHRFPETPVCVFARSPKERAFALELGAAWAGDTFDRPPFLLHAIIDTTPAWRPVVAAMACLKPGGRLVINAIRKESGDREALLTLDYSAHLWMEREIKTVANVTRRDVAECLDLAADVPLLPEVEMFALSDAEKALLSLKRRDIRGAKVLQVGR